MRQKAELLDILAETHDTKANQLKLSTHTARVFRKEKIEHSPLRIVDA